MAPKSRRPRRPARKAARRATSRSSSRRWSKRVTQTSNAMDLEGGIFKQSSARSIALSLKRSAERSRRRKSAPFRSAMSMLNLYINRAGANLSPARRRVLERAKVELRRAFHRE
jgi:uncharacterized protein DUF3175